ncbi:MAG: hypothetical protein GY909_15235 [Oligoflexia bacterium]|nr:hypothetical protein [Oligoflexia bacterium]
MKNIIFLILMACSAHIAATGDEVLKELEAIKSLENSRSPAIEKDELQELDELVLEELKKEEAKEVSKDRSHKEVKMAPEMEVSKSLPVKPESKKVHQNIFYEQDPIIELKPKM